MTIEKLRGKKNDTLEKTIDNLEFSKKTITKQKSNSKSLKSQNLSSYKGKNWKGTTIMKIGTCYLRIITVIRAIIVNMNKDINNNKQQYFYEKKLSTFLFLVP